MRFSPSSTPQNDHTTGDTGLTASYKTILRILTGLAALGIGLGIIGLNAAFDDLGGPGTPEGRVVVIAIVVAALCTAATIGYSHYVTRSALRGKH